MRFSESQQERVRQLLEDEWVTDSEQISSENLRALMAAIESPEELHEVAINFNWDCGHDLMESVLNHPLCDAGTALLIFWLGAPGFVFSAKALESGSADHEAALKFLEGLQNMYIEVAFKSARIAVDPTDIFGTNMLLEYRAENGVAVIHPLMKVASPGEPYRQDGK